MQEKTFEQQVLTWLRSKSGGVVVISAIAKKFKVGQASMLETLNEMVAAGTIRRSGAKRTAGYYVPSEGILRAEREEAERKDRQPLKVDNQRKELYAKLAAARAAIPSIG